MSDGEPEVDPLALAALQSQIVDLRELIAGLAAKLDELAPADARLAVIERVACIVSAIAGELHTNVARSDIAPLVKELKALVAPFLKEDVRAAA
ncbi:hypothetical protein [Reyranella sp.]|uniref:hypothetical protein n=1 Tax=Reyranella sp. TaxID=1929291 RepID=UPI003D099AF2